jgi:S-adenosylmethionine decarboxylase
LVIRSSSLAAVPACAAPRPAAQPADDDRLDHFITRDGVTYAGHHLIIDCFDAQGLDELERMESALRRAVEVAGATLLHIHLHHFTPNGGISGVAVLAESHISVHTWPERDFAAFDVFMCGDAEPERVIDVLRQAFSPGRIEVGRHRRGVMSEGA